ncbi:MAG TPA: TonB-dependent receptor [Pyrinomonadaceae bacterium]|jgi:iron complex outermembrane receptor protein|nr:TonB-dependent receptor [Pyrinomonadaceae bacterium]
MIVLCLGVSVRAQSGTEIHGRVTDLRNSSVAEAEVTLSARSGTQLLAATDSNGAFTFKAIAPGDYVIEVQAKGFAVFTSRLLHVGRGQSLTNDIQLSVQAVNASVVVTATGTAQTTDEISKAVSVLSDQAIESKRELTLSESLRGLPGVRVQQQGSYGALTTIRLRGQRTLDTAFLLDGLRVRDASDINGSAVPLIADLLPVDLDRVEMLRGSGSSIYGTNAIGGVLNLIPETGQGQAKFEFGFDGGSLALFRERLRGSGGLGRRVGYSFGVTRMDVRRGVDRNDQYGNTAGGAHWIFNATPKVSLSANFLGTISNARLNDSPFALPAAFTSGLYPKAVAGLTFQPDFNNPDQGRRNRVLVESIKLSHEVNDNISYSIAYQHVGTRRRNYNGSQIDPRFAAFYPFGDFPFMSTNNGGTDTIDARANLRFGKHNLGTAGFEYEHESIFQSNIPQFTASNNTTDRQRTLAFFGQDQIFLLDDRLQISLGVRSQSFKIRAADRPGFLSAIEPQNSVTGDGSLAYFIRSTNTKLRAHVGNGFRAPSLFERFGEGTFARIGFTRFGDPTLRAERSISVDAGFDQRVARDRARFGVTYFYTRLQQVIAFKEFIVPQLVVGTIPVNDPLGVNRLSGYVNQPGGISRGVESYAEVAPWRAANLRASYTFTNSDRFVPDAGTQPEYVIPRHIFGLDFSQRYRAFQINFDLNRIGAYVAPVFENNFPFRTAELTFPGYTKVDLFGSYERRVSERVVMTLFGGADNLFAAKYFENGFRAPGLTARAGVTVKIK